MPVTVRWEPTCDQVLRARYTSAFTSWVNANSTQNLQVGGRNNWEAQNVTFDEALVL